MGKEESDYSAAQEAYKKTQTDDGSDNSRHKHLKVVGHTHTHTHTHTVICFVL